MKLTNNQRTMSDKLYVLSFRDTKKTPAMCCIVELEDVILNYFNAKLISLEKEISPNSILFIAAISTHEIGHAMKTIPISKFSAIYAYVFDAFPHPLEEKRTQWSKNISTHYRAMKKVTHLFVPFRQSTHIFRELYQIPVSYIPLATDVVNYGGYNHNKIIDVNGYGRQPEKLTRLLSDRFNKRESDRIFLHTNHASISKIDNFYAHRRLFWKLLRKSRISLLFDALHTPLNRNFPFSFVPQRMFESASAGCVIAGKRPTCSEMDELFDWPDSIIELPDKTIEMIDYIEYLLDSYDLEDLGRRNYEECLHRHDWRHRIHDMLNIVKSEHGVC